MVAESLLECNLCSHPFWAREADPLSFSLLVPASILLGVISLTPYKCTHALTLTHTHLGNTLNSPFLFECTLA